ncbi:DUF4442 domain-containing protein [Tenacibaculum sp. ZS6-P6]|uniref:DUF4442 domain-containing protein n=1 Tax=Tenacibaculum sp. ZS6-P6 TaxID=3447503 RepID=UPI003F994C69
MSVYKKITEIGIKFIPKSKLFKYGFNLSPMYRRSTGRVRQISNDLLHVRVKIPLSYKNRNYVNSIFGGSLFSAVDPIPMIQLINLIGDDYVVWDKSAEVYFKRPAKENVYADFSFSMEELDQIKQRVLEEKEIEIVKTTLLTDKTNSKIFCEVHKTIYVADKDFYKEKRARKNKNN